jgi:CheY-like chemotaxis protein
MLPHAKLEGKRVLVIEDEALVACHIAELLHELGCVPSGPAPSVEAALAAIDGPGKIDCATLDVRLEDGISGHVAGTLLTKEIPFVICSAYRISLPGLDSIPVLEKPIRKEQFEASLERAMNLAPLLGLPA